MAAIRKAIKITTSAINLMYGPKDSDNERSPSLMSRIILSILNKVLKDINL
jgi:hypothetical protein